ncbi:hypothetical protein ACHQM5_029288 [Ranunculus cassubicifolius]
MALIIDELLHLPEKLLYPSSRTYTDEAKHENKGVLSIPVDILNTPKDYVFFFDVPGLSKADIQVTVEDENTLVVRSNGKRKREDEEEKGCRYIRLERKVSPKFLRKFRLPVDSNISAISAKCENGVLLVTVEKLPPPPAPKKMEVAIS